MSSVSGLLIASLLLLPQLVSSQAVQVTLIPNGLPACLQQCAAMTGPANNCVPPIAPQTTNQQYLSCFCSFSTLQSVKTSPTNLCQGTCSDADWLTIANWYKQDCGVATGPQQTTTLATVTTPAATASTSVPSSAATDSSGSVGYGDSNSGASWFSTHTNWVIMIIVLGIALAAIGAFGTWFHRRHRRRSEANHNPGNRSTPEIFTTGQHDVHDVNNHGASAAGVGVSEKGKDKAVQSGVTPVMSQQNQPAMVQDEEKKKRRLRRSLRG